MIARIAALEVTRSPLCGHSHCQSLWRSASAVSWSRVETAAQ